MSWLRKLSHWVRRLLTRKHAHEWTVYRLFNDEHHMVFFCRRCACGADQMQRAGPMGDGSWRDRSEGPACPGPLSDWELAVIADCYEDRRS